MELAPGRADARFQEESGEGGAKLVIQLLVTPELPRWPLIGEPCVEELMLKSGKRRKKTSSFGP